MTSDSEVSSALRPQRQVVKKQFAKRSNNIYGKLDKTLKLLPFEEELKLWREAIQHDQRLQVRGIEVELLDPFHSSLPSKCLKDKAPTLFIELSKGNWVGTSDCEA